MSFAHITAVAEADIPYKACAAWTYNKQDELQIYVGFSSTRELIEWMNSTVDETDGDGICISGEWEIDDTGDTYDFDGWELNAGDTWAGFKKQCRKFLKQLERDNDDWRMAVAMEEGMLNGIDSYNDWMGC